MEEFTCIECDRLYDESDGDTDERLCDECLNEKPDDVLHPNFMEQVDGLVA